MSYSSLTTKTLIGTVLENPVNELERKNYFVEEMAKKLIAEYGEEKYESVKKFQFCNALSRAESLNPAYSVGGKTESSYFEEIEFLIANYDNISCDTNASGYRLPTNEEYEALVGTSSYNRFDFPHGEMVVRKKK